MATLIRKTKKTFHLRKELPPVCNRREFSLLAFPLFSPLYLEGTTTAFSSAHPQPFVWYLVAKSGAGERRWGQGGTGVDAGFDNSALWDLQPRTGRASSPCAELQQPQHGSAPPATPHGCPTTAEGGPRPPDFNS